jgi:hypothetical protein
VHRAHDVDLVGQAGELERLGSVMLPGVIREILFRSAAVNGELAAAGAEKHASHRLFAAAGAHDPNFGAMKWRNSGAQRSSSKIAAETCGLPRRQKHRLRQRGLCTLAGAQAENL